MMLVLSRKPQERIVVGGTIRITLVAMRAQEVLIGIEAPEEQSIVCENHLASAREPTDEAPGGDPTRLACRDPIDPL
jgi:carbon storage regulator CsrA